MLLEILIIRKNMNQSFTSMGIKKWVNPYPRSNNLTSLPVRVVVTFTETVTQSATSIASFGPCSNTFKVTRKATCKSRFSSQDAYDKAKRMAYQNAKAEADRRARAWVQKQMTRSNPGSRSGHRSGHRSRQGSVSYRLVFGP